MSARFAVVCVSSLGVLLGLVGCGLQQGALGEFLRFETRPTYLCPGEEVTASWRVLEAVDSFSLLLTLRPGGLVDLPSPIPSIGSQSFLPSQPTAPGEIAATEISATAVRRGGSEATVGTGVENAIVIGSETSALHVENFGWGCDAARGGGVGWASIDYEMGQKASESIAIRQVRNLSPFPIRLGMRRGSEPLETRTLGVGETSAEFNGQFYGVWEALPESGDVWGPDGCEAGAAEGEILSGGDPEFVVVQPRPAATVGFELGCPVM